MDNHESYSTPTKKEPRNDLSIPIAIVFSGILIAGAIIFTDKATNMKAEKPADTEVAQEEKTMFPETILAIKSDDHVIGNPNAKIVVIEYSDIQCPYCQRFHVTMTSIMQSYGGTDGIAWVYRHFPLDSAHPYARKGGEALECASEQGGNVGFEKFMNALFDPATTSVAPQALPTLAASVGLDKERFSECLTSSKYADRVNRDFEEAAGVGVRGTPYSIGWNMTTKKQSLINGAQPFSVIASTLESLGAKKTQ